MPKKSGKIPTGGIRLALAECFGSLNADQRANLEYHRQKGTKILCGEECRSYVDGKGGG